MLVAPVAVQIVIVGPATAVGKVEIVTVLFEVTLAHPAFEAVKSTIGSLSSAWIIPLASHELAGSLACRTVSASHQG